METIVPKAVTLNLNLLLSAHVRTHTQAHHKSLSARTNTNQKLVSLVLPLSDDKVHELLYRLFLPVNPRHPDTSLFSYVAHKDHLETI